MAKSAPVLQLDNISIRQLDGLFSLNDLHVAAGSIPGHRPGEFVRNQRTQELITEITNAGISAIESRRGFNGGTYVCRELVIAYAAWINAAFHLKVLRAFLDTATPAPTAAPAANTTTLLPSEKGCQSMLLNPGERELIEMLRWTTYAGRDVVRETARIMRMRCPWKDGDLDGNIARAKGVQVHVTMST